MSARPSRKAMFVVVGCAAALLAAGAATALASRASLVVSAPVSKPATVAVAPSQPEAVALPAPESAQSARLTSAGQAESAKRVEPAPAIVAAPAPVEVAILSESQELAQLMKESAPVVSAAAPKAEVALPAQTPAVPVALAVASSTPEPPETEHPAEVNFKGSVESLSPLTVSGQRVVTDANTTVEGTLAVDAWVEVEGYAQPDGSVLARHIQVEHASGNDDVGEVEFKAPIVSFPASYVGDWVIGDFTVHVSDAGAVDTRGGTRLPAVGKVAEVKAIQKAGGTLEAIEIKIEDSESEFENEVEFKGVISAIGGAAPNLTLTVDGRTVLTDGNTQIDGTLAVGQTIEVRGTELPGGSIQASQIHIEDAAAQADELEFRGSVLAFPAGFVGAWQFDKAGTTVTIMADASTLVDESRGPIAVGAKVEVKAIKQAGGLWLAVRIQVEND